VTDHTPEPGHGASADEIAHDDHGHAEAQLGPIDWGAWLYAVGGFVFGMLAVGAFWLKTIGG
jgi:hypothetical protein